MINERLLIMIAIGLGAGALLWVYSRGISDTAQDVGGFAVDAIEGVTVGTIQGIGEVFGIPVTNQTQCEKDLAAGNIWDASFSCPAGTWLKSLVA